MFPASYGPEPTALFLVACGGWVALSFKPNRCPRRFALLYRNRVGRVRSLIKPPFISELLSTRKSMEIRRLRCGSNGDLFDYLLFACRQIRLFNNGHRQVVVNRSDLAIIGAVPEHNRAIIADGLPSTQVLIIVLRHREQERQ